MPTTTALDAGQALSRPNLHHSRGLLGRMVRDGAARLSHRFEGGAGQRPGSRMAAEIDRPMLTPDELERYARHIVLREVGGPGQAALKRARVLVVGAGGSARRCCSISPPPASAPSAWSTTTRCRCRTCSAR